MDEDGRREGVTSFGPSLMQTRDTQEKHGKVRQDCQDEKLTYKAPNASSKDETLKTDKAETTENKRNTRAGVGVGRKKKAQQMWQSYGHDTQDRNNNRPDRHDRQDRHDRLDRHAEEGPGPSVIYYDCKIGLDKAHDCKIGLDKAHDCKIGLDKAHDCHLGLNKAHDCYLGLNKALDCHLGLNKALDCHFGLNKARKD